MGQCALALQFQYSTGTIWFLYCECQVVFRLTLTGIELMTY